MHDSYISKFEFMNYLFANLLVAWLYVYLIDWMRNHFFLAYKWWKDLNSSC